MAGLPFSEDEISQYAFKGIVLLMLSLGFFLLGAYLLDRKQDG
jgi:hypothetical protein